MKNILFILTLFSFTAYSASWATVKVKKAVVYADKEMSSEVGFLRKDKKVRIGDKARNKGQVFPFIYQKKVLYIKKSDIQTSAELLALSSAMERIKRKTLSTDNFQKVGITAGIGTYNLQSNESYDNINSKSLSTFNLSILGHHIRPVSKDAFKVVIGADLAKLDVESFTLANLEFYYQRHLFSLYNLDLYYGAGLIWTPLFSYQYDTDFTKNGSGYGLALDLELSYNISEQYGFSLSGNYRYQELSVDLPETLELKSYEPVLTGFKTYLSFFYRY